MRSRWHRPHSDDSSPVEMRFIDMFMTALGSLLFLSLLLVFLLPQTTQSEQQSRSASTTNKTEDKDILKRWIGVFLVTDGCPANEPVLYVRYDGAMTDFSTGRPAGKMKEFDAADPADFTRLVGHYYFDLGDGAGLQEKVGSKLIAAESVGIRNFSEHHINVKFFSGIARNASNYSVYVGLSNPQKLAGDCTVRPVYLSSLGAVSGETVVLKSSKPFAWLRKFTIASDGDTSLGESPRGDEQFKRELASFSDAQSDLLCKQKHICGTVDAYLDLIAPKSPHALSFKWEANTHFLEFDYDRKNGVSKSDCEQICSDDRKCRSVEYLKDVSTCSLFSSIPRTVPDETKSRDTAIRAGASQPTSLASEPEISSKLRIVDGVDMYGGDLRREENVSSTRCAEVCLGEAACKGYSYDKWKRVCYLKRELVPLVHDPLAVTAIRTTYKLPTAVTRPLRTQRLAGQRIIGSESDVYDDISYQECESKCRGSDRCVAFSHWKNANSCVLYRSVNTIFSSEEWTSALETQQPE